MGNSFNGAGSAGTIAEPSVTRPLPPVSQGPGKAPAAKGATERPAG